MIPKFEDFLYPVLIFLKDGDSNIQDMKTKLIKYFNLSAADVTLTTKGGKTTQIIDRLSWCRQYLRRAHFIDIPQMNVWKITNRGKEFLEKHDFLTINNLMEYPEFAQYSGRASKKKTSKTKVKPAAKVEDKTEPIPEKSITVKLSDLAASANATLPQTLLEAIKQMNPKSFEVLIKKLLIAMGYGKTTEDVIVTQYVGDNGIDGYVRKDRLDIEKLCAYQAKRYTNTNVGITEMNALGGSMINCGTNCGIFVTTTDFTASAKNYNPRGYTIKRIDGTTLVNYLIEYGIGVKTERIEVKTVDTEYLNSL